MSFAQICLMVALEKGHVRNQVLEVVIGHPRSVCAIGLMVLEIKVGPKV